jgi:ribonuclease HII
MDEVGRGSLAGPVSVGLVVIVPEVSAIPTGLADSKLLTPGAREKLVPAIRSWAAAWAVGHATAAEIDRYGILIALRLAGQRAYAALEIKPERIILDGNHNWLTRQRTLPGLTSADEDPLHIPCAVYTQTKGDLKIASVAAASVLAKVERDHLMMEMAQSYPGYGWERNVGYSTSAHRRAITKLGPCAEHRRSWRPFRPPEPTCTAQQPATP